MEVMSDKLHPVPLQARYSGKWGHLVVKGVSVAVAAWTLEMKALVQLAWPACSMTESSACCDI